MQIACLKLNFYHQAADSVGLRVIRVEEMKIPIGAKLLKFILIKLRESGITSNKQKFKRMMSLWNILF